MSASQAAARREELAAIIRAQPGICLRELHRQTGMPMGSLCYHVSYMQRKHVVRQVAVGARRTFFLASQKQLAAWQVMLLRDDGLRATYEFVAQHPGCRQVDVIAAFPEVPRSTVQWRLAHLVEAGGLSLDLARLRGYAYRAVPAPIQDGTLARSPGPFGVRDLPAFPTASARTRSQGGLA